MEISRVMDAGDAESCDGPVQLGDNFRESEKLGDDLLEDLESYLQDINDRLTISRMVSDSVTRGMVTAVKQEADQKIAQKEVEVAQLKDILRLHHMCVNEDESLGSPLTCHEVKDSCHCRMSYNFKDTFVENETMRESLVSLINDAKDQFNMLKKEIDRTRGFSSIRRIGSGSELLGLSGILQDKVSERLTDVDIIFESLQATLDNVCKQAEGMLQLSNVSLYAWKQEQQFQSEIEDMVIKSCIESLQVKFEERLWDQNAQLFGNESLSWLEKFRDISSLRHELDAISKSLNVNEIGLTSLGSLEIGEEWSNDKRSDHFHRKVLSNHVSSSTLIWEGNRKHEDSNANIPENSDPAQLKQMSQVELIAEMTNMRRNHESKVEEMTEENFRLKRELLRLRERGSSLPLKKDKEFDMLKKKISHFISRLDDILMENETLYAFSENAENICSLKDRLESLVLQNRQLRDLLSDKKKEVSCLSSQVSDAEDKIPKHHLIEANLLCAIEDAHFKNSVSEDVYKCVLRELMCQVKFITEESDLQGNTLQEIYKIIFKEAIHGAKITSKYEFADLDMECIIMLELRGIIFTEALKDAREIVNNLNVKYTNEHKTRVSLEMEALEKAKALELEIMDKKRLKLEISSLTTVVEEKEKLVQETTVAVVKEKDRFELASQELENLRDQAHRQQILFLERSEESNVIKGNLAEALKQIVQYKAEMWELNLNLELATVDLRRVDDERRMLHAITQEKQKALSLVQVKEMEYQMQMESIIALVEGLSKAVVGFECRATENISNISLRLENLISAYHFLIPKADILQRTGLLYKQRLERKCSDLEKAEAEVDLLGDEVDALLSLLENIYIALDHYSPILKHYPGIIEILKLVKRKLGGESTKPV
ncbi:hypothetical protein I3760_10G107000 [Carya illinoinensis]|nr:hypothetical protein I3760_10G107000 [Carya illinoinensis]KAG2685066.1 hypothetical protein I3760_10G107000 [Carya illinoinensis]